PYDITKISQIADELESSWHRMFLLLDETTRDESMRARTRRSLVTRVREEMDAAGAGPPAPQFAHSTKKQGQCQKHPSLNSWSQTYKKPTLSTQRQKRSKHCPSLSISKLSVVTNRLRKPSMPRAC